MLADIWFVRLRWLIGRPTMKVRAAGVLAGCTNTGAVKIGKHEYQISTRVPLAGPAGAKGKAIETANSCTASQVKEMMLERVASSYECALHGECGEAEINFMCLAADDLRYQSPDPKKP